MAFASDKGRQGAAGVSTGYDIDNSLRFNDDDSAYLSRTPSTAGNRKTWTWSGWFKRSNLTTGQKFFSAGTADTNGTGIQVLGNAGLEDVVQFYTIIGGTDYGWNSTLKLRDTSAWYHLVFVYDASNSTGSDRMRAYVNSERITSFATNYGELPLNTDSFMNATNVHTIGKHQVNATTYLDGHLAEVNFVDGQALTPSDFGETDEDYGHWKAIEYAGTYGTNGFYLDFSNKATKHTITANGNAQHSTAQNKIGASSMYFDGTGDYLSIPNSDDFNFGSGDFTVEFYTRDSDHSSTAGGWVTTGTGSGTDGFSIYTADGNYHFSVMTSSGPADWAGSFPYSTNTWTHVACVRDGGTLRVYTDGVQRGTTAVSGSMDVSPSALLIGAGKHINGGVWDSRLDHPPKYMDELRISNTCRYTSGTTFTPSTTAFTEDANTLLLIHSDTTNGSTTFTDDSGVVGGLGNDASSNTNNWTVNNLAATDQMLDSPTNNFACMNPLSDSSATLSQGNLQNQYGGGNYYCPATFQLPKTGKWYWEVHITALHSNGNCYGRLGITYEDSNSKTINDGYGYGVYASGLHMLTSTGVYSTGLTDNVGDIIQFAVDMDNGKFYIGQDDTYYNTSSPYGDGNPSAGTNPSATGIDTTLDWRPDFNVGHDSSYGTKFHANFGQDSSFAGNKTAQGNQDSNSIGDFYYEPPTDFLALCTSNLPDPAVIPSEHFNTVLWTGNSSTNAITGVGFQPNLTWVKCRTDAYSHYLHDVLRTTTSFLYADQTSAENTGQTNTITSFDSDGFSLGSNAGWNASGQTYVSWNWKAGGADVLNENGTIDSQVSANADAGFSIVSWNGTGVDNSTIGHGLSKAPEMIITKKTNQSDSWNTFHKDLTSGNEIFLDLTSAQSNDSNNASWGDNHPASVGASTFAVGYAGDMNGSDVEMIAYCFHSVEGYSKVGSYTGNGSADGTFVYLGFRPSLILSKRSDSTGNWTIWDSERNGYNTSNETLHANDSTAEANETRIDLTSNGFKYLLTGGDYNASGGTYIYIAFAETPFKYTNAR